MRLTVGRLAGVAIASVALSGAASAQGPVDLGSIPGYPAGRAWSVNARGDVVGQVARGTVEPIEQAVLWTRHGREYDPPEALEPVPGFDRSDARDFAGLRSPVGSSSLLASGRTRYRATLWRDDASGRLVPVDLEPPPGLTDARAWAANHRGQVAGEALNATQTVNGLVARHAVLWRAGPHGVETCDLGVPEGFDTSVAWDVNDAGDVVGIAYRRESDGAGGLRVRATVFVWARPHGAPGPSCEPVVPQALGGHEELHLKQSPSINERGDVVARGDRVGQPTLSRPLLWERQGRDYAEALELPRPEGFTDAYARDLNSRGQVVGTALVRGPTNQVISSRAVLWTYEGGRWQPTVLPSPPGTSTAGAEHVSETGDVVGTSPVPAKGSGALLWEARGR